MQIIKFIDEIKLINGISDVVVKDLYQQDESINYTLSYSIQSLEKTLTGVEIDGYTLLVNKAIKKIIENV